MTFTTRVIDTLSSLQREDWNTLITGSCPFLQYDFLNGLEVYGCLEKQHWQSCHILVNDDNKLVGALPLYQKQDSYGEFVFDWAWADAYQRAGRAYYPKLVSAIPFTPVTGPRLLTHPDYSQPDIETCIVDELIHYATRHHFSSAHCLFYPETGTHVTERDDILERIGCQYHWFNKDYRDFQDFLDALRARKRKKIRSERQQILNPDLEIRVIQGKEITEAHWSAFYEFYCTTFYKKWGEPRFTLEFLLSLSETLPDSSLLFMAYQNDTPIAGAFSMRDDTILYGRHWGCSRHIPFLHFELCYYQTIEYCIEHKLQRLDAGAQGEHKINRGFEPVLTHSWHWIRDNDFRMAISAFLEQEHEAIKDYCNELKQHSAYTAAQDMTTA